MSRVARLAVASLVSMSAFGLEAQANLITNGSFESSTLGETYGAPTNFVTGWDATAGSTGYQGVKVVNSPTIPNQDGNNYLNEQFGIVSTDAAYRPAVTVGEPLTLSLLYSPAGVTYDPTHIYLQYYDASNNLLSSATANVINGGSNSGGGASNNFVTLTGTSTVPANAATVGVQIVTPAPTYSAAILIDNVQLNGPAAATPEPASLGAIGMAALLLGRRRRMIA